MKAERIQSSIDDFKTSKKFPWKEIAEGVFTLGEFLSAWIKNKKKAKDEHEVILSELAEKITDHQQRLEKLELCLQLLLPEHIKKT